MRVCRTAGTRRVYVLSTQQVVSKVSAMLNLVTRAVSEGKEPWKRGCSGAALVGKKKKSVSRFHLLL